MSSKRTDNEQLQLLLGQDESATLEFKREWYKIDGDSEAKRRQKDELIKDILSLANGNAYSAGEAAFLIVGANDRRGEDGSRELCDVGESIPTAVSLLELVRPASYPPLENLEVVPFQVEKKRLFAVIIPPSPHLHETTRRIDAPSQSFTKHVVFIRRNESVDVASAKEREVIKRQKEIRFAETQNAPPVLFGAGVGATIGGVMLARYGEKIAGRREGTIAGLIVGSLTGGLFGGLMGSSYKTVMEIQANWSRVPLARRLAALAGGALSAVVVWIAGAKIGNVLGKRTEKNR